LPAAEFTSAIAELTFENSQTTYDASLYLNFIHTVPIPTNGRIIVGFHHQNED
jgi:hypothetical protein